MLVQRSFWSDTPDGAEVPNGGASGEIVAATRNLYTNVGTGSNLTDAENQLAVANALITNSMLGLNSYSTATERDDLIDWYRASPYGDPLHSQPKMIDYGTQKVVYIGTNSGFLHAVDATYPSVFGEYIGGNEIFSFVPKELLKNVYALNKNYAWGSHLYGMDGDITIWHKDDDNNGSVNGSDKVTLIAGMRRGGSSYYALDVTNPSDPKIKWIIDPSVSRL